MKIAKSVSSVFLISSFIAITSGMKPFLRGEEKRRRVFTRMVSLYSRIFLRLLDIELVIENKERIDKNKNYFIVSNHMSYLDAILVSALRPVSYVTSVEMREKPVLGLLTELGGCIYTERRSRDNIHLEVSSLAKALEKGFDVVIFPEATSTNGEKLLPFKRSLLNAAVQSKRDILPLVIQYEEINGERVTPKNRDFLCWYGDMAFAGHFFALQGLRGIRIRMKVLEEIPVTPESTRDTLVDEAYARIKSAFKPIA